jgi:hypothetical protein
MFRRDILFTVFVVGFLALLSATIHNAHTLLQGEEDMGNDMLAPIRTIVKLTALLYDRMIPGGIRMAYFLDKYRALLHRQEPAAVSEETIVEETTPAIETAEVIAEDAAAEDAAAEDAAAEEATVEPPISQEHED